MGPTSKGRNGKKEVREGEEEGERVGRGNQERVQAPPNILA